MQPTTALGRALILANGTTVGGGLDLVDLAGNVLADLSADVTAGTVTYNGGDKLGLSFALARELQWGSAIVRPRMLLELSGRREWFPQGCYRTSTPQEVSGQTPKMFSAQGFDITIDLDRAIETSRSYPPTTTLPLTVAQQLIAEVGGRVLVDSAAATQPLTQGRTYVVTDNVTRRQIVNDMLKAVGYRPVWMDWEGRYRLDPAIAAVDRASEWDYTTAPGQVMVKESATLTSDFFDAPNVWIVRADTPGLTTPTAGNGLAIRENTDVGPTSIAARGGQRIPTNVAVPAVNQAALEVAADRVKEEGLRPDTQWAGQVAANPAHWHEDVVTLTDPDLGLDRRRFMVRSWVLDFVRGTAGSHTWQAI